MIRLLFGFNGQEKDDEVYGAGNAYAAEFWEYDPRLGRRFNIDPVVKPWESGYATFSNNPIYYVDPHGDDPSPGDQEPFYPTTDGKAPAESAPLYPTPDGSYPGSKFKRIDGNTFAGEELKEVIIQRDKTFVQSNGNNFPANKKSSSYWGNIRSAWNRIAHFLDWAGYAWSTRGGYDLTTERNSAKESVGGEAPLGKGQPSTSIPIDFVDAWTSGLKAGLTKPQRKLPGPEKPVSDEKLPNSIGKATGVDNAVKYDTILQRVHDTTSKVHQYYTNEIHRVDGKPTDTLFNVPTK